MESGLKIKTTQYAVRSISLPVAVIEQRHKKSRDVKCAADARGQQHQQDQVLWAGEDENTTAL